ncbi:DUF402 domain-containing protein [Salarchaeum sp. JOR-1]|uniref:DUF402 domain-containing protein n=1 Tax=Salarchaeum sp. JOR-1 TaxID=2599399 RepID=UPI001198B5BE|nr:DUF402 domain-containing protein [Salarchaeum sp. JOR-1]QDX39920.1 DUF402 domain-containing protein [Salarchaeum sp. JOR-1]
MTVSVRGIYATALTELLAEVGVTNASAPIRERFDRDFSTGPAAAHVSTTSDRQGVGVTGDPDTVGSVVERLREVGADTFRYRDRAPRGAVFEGRVEETRSGGAVVDLGETDGYLPFEESQEYVEEGDTVRVQVVAPKPPWVSRRPRLSTDIRAFGDAATLVRGRDALVADTPNGAPELARTTEILPPDVPADWAVAWEDAAADLSMDALGDALAAAVEAAESLEGALGGGVDVDDVPARIAAPDATTWVWFGGDARRALDDVRRNVTETIAGHHRIKAGSSAASTAVDFAEALGSLPDEFPFAAVSEQFGPAAGDRVAIEHGKPDGRLITLGRGDVTDCDRDAARITVEREMTAGGTYDALDVERQAGDVAVTRFQEGRWWYPTVYRGEDGTRRGTYINVNTPLELFPSSVRYVDLHLDVVKHADGTVEQVDADELQECVEDGLVTEDVAETATDVADRIENAFS